jgi:hypothetical protein
MLKDEQQQTVTCASGSPATNVTTSTDAIRMILGTEIQTILSNIVVTPTTVLSIIQALNVLTAPSIPPVPIDDVAYAVLIDMLQQAISIINDRSADSESDELSQLVAEVLSNIFVATAETDDISTCERFTQSMQLLQSLLTASHASSLVGEPSLNLTTIGFSN